VENANPILWAPLFINNLFAVPERVGSSSWRGFGSYLTQFCATVPATVLEAGDTQYFGYRRTTME